MTSQRSVVDFVLEQVAKAGTVSARAMFGEYGVWCDGKMVALVCDDRLFVKATAGGRAFAGRMPEAPPYPGARPCLVIAGELWDDAAWLTELFRISAAELPKPARKKNAKA